jgi:hypothetical protein
MWMTARLHFRLILKCCSRTDRRYERSPVHTAVAMNTAVTAVWYWFYSTVVLWLKGIAINWLQMLKINLLPKWSWQKNKPYCRYLQIRQAGSSATSVCIYRHHSVFWPSLQQFGFIIKAPATVIFITVPCIIMCSGSRTSKESAVCHLLVWCENMNQNWSYEHSCVITE